MRTGQLLEIACDESGSEGEKLVGGNTDVFAHAGVRLTVESAQELVRELRRRIGSPAQEYKANHLLREKHRAVLEWVLEPAGPIHGSAHVHLVDKTFYFLGKAVEIVGGEPGMAATLYRDGPGAFGRARWEAFLVAFNDVLRARPRRGDGVPADVFFDLVNGARRAGALGEIMDLLWRAGPRIKAYRAGLPATVPALDPMIPAIVRTVAHWSDGGRPVSIVHDEQPALTEDRVARLGERIGGAGIRFVDSRSDARVQVADYLAGVARKIASNELNDRGDAVLTALLRPYVDAGSVWGDPRSWGLLAP